MTARELLSAMAFCLATGETPKTDDWYPDPRSFEAAVEAFRAEVLNEAADALAASEAHPGCPGCKGGVQFAVAKVRRMAEHAAAQPDTTKEQH